MTHPQKTHRRHPTKAHWTKGELRRVRKHFARKYGSGPRAEQQILAELRYVKKLGPEDRQAVRRRLSDRQLLDLKTGRWRR